jgi:AbrB family looped-hinge helix DNA binding protein
MDNLPYFWAYLKERIVSIANITLSSKGQVVIPKEIRDQLHWEAGHELSIETTESGVLLKSRPSKKTLRLEALRGFLKSAGTPMSTEELCQPVDYGADWAAAEKRSR